jgi:hypoxanthine-DNA glycosylase
MTTALIETHPFAAFVPENIEYLIIGSFPGKGQTDLTLSEEHWFYGAKRNLFWKIIEQVYGTPLQNTTSKQNLFIKAKIGIADIILKAIRTENKNADTNLKIVELNYEVIEAILGSNYIKTIFFTSKFVEKLFRKLFPDVNNTIVLPSPSPRYARMNLQQKINVYKKYLPDLS